MNAIVQTAYDRSFPLEQMVEAHRYADTGQKLGNIVVTVASGDAMYPR